MDPKLPNAKSYKRELLMKSGLRELHPQFDQLSPAGRALLESREEIIEEWSSAVRQTIRPASELNNPILVDSVPLFINNLAESLTPGMSRRLATRDSNIGEEHGGERARLSNYNPAQLIKEYQILRRVLFSNLSAKTKLCSAEKEVIYSSIDEAVLQSTQRFTEVQTSIREQFIATLTHDLRNPLTVAKMATEAISRAPHSTEISGFATKALDAIERINIMIEELLDATYIKAGGSLQLAVSEFDLQPLISSLLQRMSLAHGDRFIFQGSSVKGFWDRRKLERAIANLITNAVKYGADSAPILVKLWSAHGRTLITVNNQGRPIHKEEQELIFEAFRRSRSQANGKQGWGLGLAMVRGVAIAHGGSIHVDSNAETGTTFQIDIPNDSRQYLKAPQNI